MEHIAEAARPVVEAALQTARRRQARLAALRSAAERALTASPDGADGAVAASARRGASAPMRERFRRAHRLETLARDRAAALEAQLGAPWRAEA